MGSPLRSVCSANDIKRWAMGSPKKVTICPSGSNRTILGFVAVTKSDCLASLWISITEKTTFIHHQLRDDYTTFSCAWVRHRLMRDCLENGPKALQCGGSPPLCSASKRCQGTALQGASRTAPEQWFFMRLGALPAHGGLLPKQTKRSSGTASGTAEGIAGRMPVQRPAGTWHGLPARDFSCATPNA